MRIEAGGLIGRHGAQLDQVFLVVTGSGYAVDQAGRRFELTAGSAVRWARGQAHETFSHSGMVAVILQGHFRD